MKVIDQEQTEYHRAHILDGLCTYHAHVLMVINARINLSDWNAADINKCNSNQLHYDILVLRSTSVHCFH